MSEPQTFDTEAHHQAMSVERGDTSQATKRGYPKNEEHQYMAPRWMQTLPDHACSILSNTARWNATGNQVVYDFAGGCFSASFFGQNGVRSYGDIGRHVRCLGSNSRPTNVRGALEQRCQPTLSANRFNATRSPPAMLRRPLSSSARPAEATAPTWRIGDPPGTGVAHPGRFSTGYRRVSGRLPSRTMCT